MKKLFVSLALLVLSGCAVTDVRFVSAGEPDFVPTNQEVKEDAKVLATAFDRPIELYFNIPKKTQLALGVLPVGSNERPGCVLVYQKDLWERAMPRIGFESNPDKLLRLFVAHEITHCYVHHNSNIKSTGIQAESLADAGALLYVALNEPDSFDGLALDLARLRHARQSVDAGRYPTVSQVKIMAQRAKALASALPSGSPITLELLDKVHPFLLRGL